MNVLAIDTATARCSVALCTGSGNGQHMQDSSGRHSSLVLGMIRELLCNREMTLGDLDLVAVDVGPGSFTGLRVGVGIAQGLAYAAGLPVVGIGSLAALSSAYPQQTVIPALDARMNQVYWGVYRAGECIVQPHVDDPCRLGSELASLSLPDTPMGVGNGWTAYPDAMPVELAGRPREIRGEHLPEALQIARLAASAGPEERVSPLGLEVAYVRNRVAEAMPGGAGRTES